MKNIIVIVGLMFLSDLAVAQSETDISRAAEICRNAFDKYTQKWRSGMEGCPTILNEWQKIEEAKQGNKDKQHIENVLKQLKK